MKVLSMPDDVCQFAQAHALTSYLDDLLTLTRDVFPDRPISVQLDCDPSIPDDWYVVFRVDVGDMTAEQLYTAHVRWIDGLVARCPPDRRQFFHLGI